MISSIKLMKSEYKLFNVCGVCRTLGFKQCVNSTTILGYKIEAIGLDRARVRDSIIENDYLSRILQQ